MAPSISAVLKLMAVVLILAGGLASLRGVGIEPAADSVAREHSDGPTAGSDAADGVRLDVSQLGSGRTLQAVLRERGFGPLVVQNLLDLVRPYANPGALGAGAEVRFDGDVGGLPRTIAIVLDQDRALRLRSHGARWSASIDSVPVGLDTVVVAGVMTSGMFTTDLFGEAERLTPDEVGALILSLSRVFAWQVDFFRDVRAGDAFRVALERTIRPDGTVRGSRLIAGEFSTGARHLTAFRFADAGPGADVYYDRDSRPLRGAFLRAPLELVRVTSGFDARRFHPVLERRRPHTGVDYGAPQGTPVRATSAGRVVRAGWLGEYGQAIEIRHGGGLATRYGHLSQIATGITRGSRVEQGQLIGRVGATGLATGPHLHYELLRDGRPADPAGLAEERGAALAGEPLAAFEYRRDLAAEILERAEWPGSGPDVANVESQLADPESRDRG